MANVRHCEVCRQEDRVHIPLYWLRGSRRFVCVCESCLRDLAAGMGAHAEGSLLAVWEELADRILERLG
jgi:hypothetical protein